MRRARVGWGAAVALYAAIVAFGIGSAWLASRPPSIALGAGSTALLGLFLATGLALGVAGCLSLVLYPGERFGPLAIAAAVAWFATGWTSPGVGSAPLFTVGLVLASATPALVGDAVLGYGGPATGPIRILAWTGYLANVLLLGLVPAVTSVQTEGCAACPSNLLGVMDAPATGRLAVGSGLTLAAVWAAGVAATAGVRTLAATPAGRRMLAPVVIPGAVAILAFGAEAARSLPRGWMGVDAFDQGAWAVQASALIAMSAGSCLRVVRARRTRGAVASMVLDLARGGEAGGLQDRLRALLGDPLLVLAYPTGDGRLIDGRGEASPPLAGPGRQMTPLVRDGEVVAVIGHRSGLEQDSDRMTEIATAAGLALDHERLLAVSRARLADVRSSRSRVVEANDRERARLERDLHDGAQQRLAGLALAIRVVRSARAPGLAATRGGTTYEQAAAADAILAEAEAEVRAVIADVRDVAHGIYPAVLADMGLGPAAAALAEGGSIPLTITAMPAERLPASVEATAYLVIAQGPARVGAQRARVRGEHADDMLRLYLALDLVDGAGPVDLTELEDRVGALDGTIALVPGDRTLAIEVAIPCGL